MIRLGSVEALDRVAHTDKDFAYAVAPIGVVFSEATADVWGLRLPADS